MKSSTSQNWSGLKPITIVTSLVVVLVLAVAPPVAGGSAKRWAGRGAAGGAIVGLIAGGDLGSAAVGAAVGAGVGAAGGAISDSKKKKAQKAELEELRQKEAERQAAAANDLPQSEEEWVAAIGQDNVSALDALIDCQHDRAALLAQAAATSENPEFRVLATWFGALTAIDREDSVKAEDLLTEVIAIDDEIDTMQEANLMAGEAMAEIKRTRATEGISCGG